MSTLIPLEYYLCLHTKQPAVVRVQPDLFPNRRASVLPVITRWMQSSRDLILKVTNPVFTVSNVLTLLGGKTYPALLAVTGSSRETLDFIRTTRCRHIAEIGVYDGATSLEFAKFLSGSGELHLFDFDDRVEKVGTLLVQEGYPNFVKHGNSYKTMDSYNWSLMRMLQKNPQPVFDYVFIDGAHTWSLDALSFMLADKLLMVGGYVDFDDYAWTMKQSLSLNPDAFPLTELLYTEEQIAEQQVRLVVDLLVKRSNRYVEVVPNRIYQKVQMGD